MSETTKRRREAEKKVDKYQGPLYIGSDDANKARHALGNLAEQDAEMYRERERHERAAAGKERPQQSKKWTE